MFNYSTEHGLWIWFSIGMKPSAYGMPVKETTESSCVAELMRRYQALTAAEAAK